MKNRKITAFILALSVCAVSAGEPAVYAAGDKPETSSAYSIEVTETGKLGENISYELYSTGMLKIKGYGRMSDFTVSPFSDPLKISSVIFEADENKSFENIGSYVFESCVNMYGINIPETVKEIGTHAFENCAALSEIIIPDSVECIRKYAFKDCTGVLTADIGNGIKKVGKDSAEEGIFQNCRSMKTLSVPSIETGVDLYSDKVLETGQIIKFFEPSVTFSSDLYIGTNSPSYDLETVIIKSGDTIYPYEFAGLNADNFVFPDTITMIGSHGFYECKSLEEIEIPESVKEIGESAFASCEALEKITIHNTLEIFGDKAFKTSFGVKQHFYFDGTKDEWDAYNVFFKTGSIKVHYTSEENPVLPEHDDSHSDTAVIREGKISDDISYRLLEDGCLIISGSGDTENFKETPFEFADEIKRVTFECDDDSVITGIGSKLFKDCTNIESVTLNEGLLSIGAFAFSGCTSLREITVPDSVKCVRNFAFENCKSMKKAVLGKGLEYIGEGSAEFDIFNGCSSLSELTMPSLITSTDDEKLDEYGEKTDETVYGQVIKFFSGTGTKFLSNGSFSSTTNVSFLKKITISSGERIYPYAFAYMDITEIILPDTIKEIDDCAFYECDLIKEMDIRNTVSIGKSAVHNCDNLKKLILGSVLKNYTYNSFSFTYPDTVIFCGTEEEWDALTETEKLFDKDVVRFETGQSKLPVVGSKAVSPDLLEKSRGCGDINEDGITDITDLSHLSLYLINDCGFTASARVYADVTLDGIVSLPDLAALKQQLAKIQ